MAILFFLFVPNILADGILFILDFLWCYHLSKLEPFFECKECGNSFTLKWYQKLQCVLRIKNLQISLYRLSQFVKFGTFFNVRTVCGKSFTSRWFRNLSSISRFKNLTACSRFLFQFFKQLESFLKVKNVVKAVHQNVIVTFYPIFRKVFLSKTFHYKF